MQRWFNIMYDVDEMTGFHSEILSKAERKQLLRQQRQRSAMANRYLMTALYSRMTAWLGDGLVKLGSQLQTRAATLSTRQAISKVDMIH